MPTSILSSTARSNEKVNVFLVAENIIKRSLLSIIIASFSIKPTFFSGILPMWVLWAQLK